MIQCQKSKNFKWSRINFSVDFTKICISKYIQSSVYRSFSECPTMKGFISSFIQVLDRIIWAASKKLKSASD